MTRLHGLTRLRGNSTKNSFTLLCGTLCAACAVLLSVTYELRAEAAMRGAEEPAPSMVSIPEGAFVMGSNEAASWEGPEHEVVVSGFSISRRPVSIEEFRAFRPGHPAAGDANAAVTEVSWQDAVDYCKWLSQATGEAYRLPTEAEWERAIRGGLDGKRHPWGDTALPKGSALPTNGYDVELGPENLWQWVSDDYSARYFSESPRRDPQGPSRGSSTANGYKVLRGGGFLGDPNSVLSAKRGSARPDTASRVISFRVAVSEAMSPTVAIGDWTKNLPPLTPPPFVEPESPSTPTPPASQVVSKGITQGVLQEADQELFRVEAPSAAILRGKVTVTGARIFKEGSELVVRLETNGPTRPGSFVLDGPDRLVVDLRGAVLGIAKHDRDFVLGQNGVGRVRLGQYRSRPLITRAVIDLEAPVEFEVSQAELGPAEAVVTIRVRRQ